MISGGLVDVQEACTQGWLLLVVCLQCASNARAGHLRPEAAVMLEEFCHCYVFFLIHMGGSGRIAIINTWCAHAA